MAVKICLSKEIESRFGTVKRAKGTFLYTAKGVRLTDMYLEDGRAILGWSGGSASTQLKNVLSRGLTGSYITDFDSRLEKAVSELLCSERKVFPYCSEKELPSSIKTKLYQPWAPNDLKYREEPSLVIKPPFPWADSLLLLALKADCEEIKPLAESAAADCSKLPAPLTAAVTRSIYDLIAALQVREEKNWFLYDKFLNKYWKRNGPYLYSKIPEEKYNDFVIHCLDCHLVINPDVLKPSIVPFGADKGVFSLLEKNPFAL